MLDIVKISDNVIKIPSDSNCYIVEKSILIDTSGRGHKKEIAETVASIVPLDKIKAVIFTHLHYDHIGNFDLFKNAKFYCSGDIIADFNGNKNDFVLNLNVANMFNVKLLPVNIPNINSIFDIIATPGHCSSSIILHYKKDNVLFTGDTYFYEGCYGRIDLPSSVPDEMHKSINKVKDLIKRFNPTICPGHDY